MVGEGEDGFLGGCLICVVFLALVLVTRIQLSFSSYQQSLIFSFLSIK